MPRLSAISAAAAAAVLLAACASGPEVRSDYDHQADFSRYRTFGFMPVLGTDKSGYGTLLTERLKQATRSQMEMRGYVYTETRPDLRVNFNASLRHKTDVVPAPPVAPYYRYRAGLYAPWPGYREEVYQYTEGTLNIDLVDVERNQMVWEGMGTAQVDDAGQAQSETNVEKGVAAIFARFPFRAGSGAVQAPPKRP